MHNYEAVYSDIKAHAEGCVPFECCGVVIIFKGRYRYIPCKNDYQGVDNFILNATDYANAEDLGEVAAIVHSHVTQGTTFSEIDNACLNRGDIPWLLYSIASDSFAEKLPINKPVDYLGRRYIYAVQDCYTIIQDYFKYEYKIDLPDPPPQDPMDLTLGEGLYKQFADFGFVEIPMKDLQPGDCIIMCINNRSQEPTHAAVYLGGNMILHHPAGRLSGRDVYGGYWMKNTWKCVRYKELIK